MKFPAQLYFGNQFIICKENFLSTEGVPGVTVSLVSLPENRRITGVSENYNCKGNTFRLSDARQMKFHAVRTVYLDRTNNLSCALLK